MEMTIIMIGMAIMNNINKVIINGKRTQLQLNNEESNENY